MGVSSYEMPFVCALTQRVLILIVLRPVTLELRVGDSHIPVVDARH